MRLRLLSPLLVLCVMTACKSPGGSGSGSSDSVATAAGGLHEDPLGQFGYDMKWVGRFDRYMVILQSGRSKIIVGIILIFLITRATVTTTLTTHLLLFTVHLFDGNGAR